MAPPVSNLFTPVAAAGRDEVVRLLVETPLLRLEQIVSYGQPTPAGTWYDQTQDEWVMLGRGRAVLVFSDGTQRDLEAGDHLLIPARLRHRVETCSSDAVWLALHFFRT